MEWLMRPFVTLWEFFCPRTKNHITYHHTPPQASGRKVLKKAPFYGHISAKHIGAYQKIIDKAFTLSPSLEFTYQDGRFHRLMGTADAQGLSGFDLELMRMQYLLADREKREKYRHMWAHKVVNRQENDFFPSPWTILAAVFSETPA